MTLDSKPFYWMTCDAPECGVKSTEGGEFDAWADSDTAIDDARNSDFWVDVKGDGRAFCEEHAPRCDQLLDDGRQCGLVLEEDSTCADANHEKEAS